MIDFLEDLDSRLFLFFNDGMRMTFLDKTMMLYTGRYIWIPMYAAILLVFLRSQRWSTAAVLTFACVAAVAVTDQVCAGLIRPLVERLRPSNVANPLSEYVHIVDNYRGGMYGFPSCHAANSFALTVFMSCLVRKRGFVAFMLLWAVINSYSRLYIGVHYPGDILVGVIIGSLIGYICYAVVARISKAYGLIDRAKINEPLFSMPFGSALKVPAQKRLQVTAPGIVMFIGFSVMVGIVLAAA